MGIHFSWVFIFVRKNFSFFWENLFIWNNSFNSIMMFSRGSSWCLNLLRLNHMQIQEIELNVCQWIAASNFPNLFYSNIDLVKTLRYIFSSFIRKNQNRIVQRPWATSILSSLFTKKSDFIAPKFHGLFCVNFKSNRLQHFRFTREQKKWYRNLVWTNHMKKISPTPIADGDI